MTRTSCLLLLLILVPFFTVYGQVQGQQLRELEARVVTSSGGFPVFTEHPTMAVISLRSNLSNLRFVSTLDIVHEYNDPAAGVYTLIVPPSRQSIRISAPGYMELAVTVPLTEARQVLFYEVRERPVSTTQQSVVFRVEPKDARLSIDGVDYGTPSEPVRVATGTRQVRLERAGYTPLQTQIEVNDTSVLFEYTLDRIDPVEVEVRTVPAGVRVFIDGVELGETDEQGIRQFFRFPGTYELEVSLNGFLSQRREIEVSKDSQNRFEFSLERNTGTLRVQVNPADARVEINRQPVGIGQSIELPPGLHRVEVSREGFAPQTDDVTITRGEVLQRRYELVAHTGRLQYTVSPSFAQTVLIDQSGREVDRWTGIKVLNDLKVGIYMLRVTATGYDDQSKPIQIRTDQLEEVMVTLTQQSLRLETSPQSTSRSSGRDTETLVVDVRNPATGRTWMDRNLGASRAATSSTDTQAYGDLYQWGRRADGHQKRNSSTISTLSTTDTPSHGSFILAPNSPNDWRNPQNNNLWQGVNGVNNPCPVGYRIPTAAEWTAERQSWSSNNSTGVINSTLKLPMAGYRYYSNGSPYIVGSGGYYWSSPVNGSLAQGLYFFSADAGVDYYHRAGGLSVRCLKD